MSYDGGKGGAGVAQWIINQLPPHRRYIELYLGGGAILRTKRPAVRSFGVEINPRVVAELWQDHGRPDLTVICGDALDALDRLPIDAETLIYCDPPYLLETRSCQRPLYEFELMEHDEHARLLHQLCALPAMVAISGYWSALYAGMLASWRTSSFQTVNRAGKPATERLWMSYPAPLELHDYRFLGRDFRERERIKRKKQRWLAKLRAMPELERYALMEAIGALRACTDSCGDAADGPTAAWSDAADGPTAAADDVGQLAAPLLAMVERV